MMYVVLFNPKIFNNKIFNTEPKIMVRRLRRIPPEKPDDEEEDTVLARFKKYFPNGL